MSFGRRMLEHWSLDPGVTYLNHGTVGAVPRRVQAAQQSIRDEIERQPSRFMLREVSSFVGVPRQEPTRLRRAAEIVAAFVGARGDDLVFVDNATAGVNAVLRSLSFEPDDEVLITDHAYGAIRRVATFVTRERGVRLHTVTVPYPKFDGAELLDAVADAIGPGPASRSSITSHRKVP